MTVLITTSTFDNIDGGLWFEATCKNKSAWISISLSLSQIRVCCKNAAHGVWRGSGRGFDSVAEALEGYRSGEIKAIIRASIDEYKRLCSEPDDLPCYLELPTT